jgi:hypothetical protein
VASLVTGVLAVAFVIVLAAIVAGHLPIAEKCPNGPLRTVFWHGIKVNTHHIGVFGCAKPAHDRKA